MSNIYRWILISTLFDSASVVTVMRFFTTPTTTNKHFSSFDHERIVFLFHFYFEIYIFFYCYANHVIFGFRKLQQHFIVIKVCFLCLSYTQNTICWIVLYMLKLKCLALDVAKQNGHQCCVWFYWFILNTKMQNSHTKLFNVECNIQFVFFFFCFFIIENSYIRCYKINVLCLSKSYLRLQFTYSELLLQKG